MEGYATTNGCREVYLRNYFGETNAEPCGYCDNCKSSKMENSLSIVASDINKVQELLKVKPRTPDELKNETRWNSEKLKSVVNYMEREQIVSKVNNESEEYRLS